MRVGLTGGIASGKSTVSAMLRDLGAVVIDADLLAREVVEPGTRGLSQVVAAFGDGVLSADGALDRPAVGRLVFADEDARRGLESIVHPLVHERIRELEQQATPDAIVVHDIPLLAEGGAERSRGFDAVIVVDVPEDVQVERLARDRGVGADDARARIAAQATREQRRAIATHVIDNTGSLDDLKRRVVEVFDQIGGRA